MRPVRPGEFPAPLSVWRWKETGNPLLVLGIRPSTASWGTTQSLVCVNLGTLEVAIPPDRNWAWTAPAYKGVGAVLRDWQCLDEAPDA
jgi:hypothetical protein